MTTSWSNDETVALINTYRDKWYSLRRSKLRATDWQEVADAVVGHCTGNPPKTSVQCQHKMEKLRKRYRAELQNVGDFNYSKSLHKYSSSWIYFKLMYCLESGDYCSDPSVNRVNRNKQDIPLYDLHCNGIKHGVTLPLNKRYHGGSTGSRISHKKVSSLDEMMCAIERLGDGFEKMERVKMDMTRELESLRMKMERKRTEMVIETQRKVWDLSVEMVMEKEKKNKKIKGMGIPGL